MMTLLQSTTNQRLNERSYALQNLIHSDKNGKNIMLSIFDVPLAYKGTKRNLSCLSFKISANLQSASAQFASSRYTEVADLLSSQVTLEDW